MKTIYTKTVCSFLLALGLHATVNAQRIACGGWHSAVICADSTVKCFGENATGQLGNSDNTYTDSNVPVAAGTLTNIVAVSAGGDQLEAHTMALKADGTVWAWGSNLYGGLGNGSTNSTTAPVQSILLSNMVAISAGGWHSVALKSDSTVWTWGWNTDGQLGDGTTTDRTIAAQVPNLTGVVAIAAGTYHVLALKADGTVWAWGDNVKGQIGNGTVTTDLLAPVQVSGLTDVVKIKSGRFFSLAVKSDSTVWTWGENLYGQLGDGTTTDRYTPVQVPNLTGVTDVTCGAFEVHVTKSDNTVWAWGRNTYGNIGDNTLTHRSSPVQMLGIADVAGMAAGTNFCIVYKTDGTLWGCGRNLSGQLGDGSFTQHNVLTKSNGVCPIVTQPISGINEADFFATVSTFPNPSASGKFNVQFSDISFSYANTLLEVFDVVGKKIAQLNVVVSALNTTLSVDLADQANGIYFMTISADGQRISQKLIKQ
ncbi:MAG: T9SS type A sorting domain-containing protein [Chitinophagales bacterium]|nr:T9SS type A sorting domain-containing protein [Chitinophagales bacterium]